MADENTNSTNPISNILNQISDTVNYVTSGGLKEDIENAPNTILTDAINDTAQRNAEESENNVYLLTEGAGRNEVYTGAQINQMRAILAWHDGRQQYGEDHPQTLFSNDDVLNSDEYNNNVSALTGGQYAGLTYDTTEPEHDEEYEENERRNERIGVSGSINDVKDTKLTLEDNGASFGAGSQSVTIDGHKWDAYNTFDISCDEDITKYHSEEDLDKMRQIVAEADAIDGNGTYTDNLEKLQGDYSIYNTETASELMQEAIGELTDNVKEDLQNSLNNLTESISNTFAGIGAGLSANDAIGAGVVTVGAVNAVNTGGISEEKDESLSDFSQAESVETETLTADSFDSENMPSDYDDTSAYGDEPQNLYLIGTPEYSGHMQYTHEEDGLEAYTTDEISQMRQILADHYDISEEELSTYTDSEEPDVEQEGLDLSSISFGNHTTVAKDAEGVLHGESFGVLGHDSARHGDTAESMVWSRSRTTYKIDNQLDMSEENIEAGDWTENDYEHMKEVIAVADACDGKGNYEDNIASLNEMCPNAMIFNLDVIEPYICRESTKESSVSNQTANEQSKAGRDAMTDNVLGETVEKIADNEFEDSDWEAEK